MSSSKMSTSRKLNTGDRQKTDLVLKVATPEVGHLKSRELLKEMFDD